MTEVAEYLLCGMMTLAGIVGASTEKTCDECENRGGCYRRGIGGS